MDYLIKLILGKESIENYRLRIIIIQSIIWLFCVEIAVYIVKSKGYQIASVEFNLNNLIRLFTEYYLLGGLLLIGGIYVSSFLAVKILEFLSIGFWGLYFMIFRKRRLRRRRILISNIVGQNSDFIKRSIDQLKIRSEMESYFLWIVGLLSIIIETIVKEKFEGFYSTLWLAFFYGFLTSSFSSYGSNHFRISDLQNRFLKKNRMETTTS